MFSLWLVEGALLHALKHAAEWESTLVENDDALRLLQLGMCAVFWDDVFGVNGTDCFLNSVTSEIGLFSSLDIHSAEVVRDEARQERVLLEEACGRFGYETRLEIVGVLFRGLSTQGIRVVPAAIGRIASKLSIRRLDYIRLRQRSGCGG